MNMEKTKKKKRYYIHKKREHFFKPICKLCGLKKCKNNLCKITFLKYGFYSPEGSFISEQGHKFYEINKKKYE